MPRRKEYKPALITNLIEYPQSDSEKAEWILALAQFAQPLRIDIDTIFWNHHPKIKTTELPECREETLILLDGRGSRVGSLNRILNNNRDPYPGHNDYYVIDLKGRPLELTGNPAQVPQLENMNGLVSTEYVLSRAVYWSTVTEKVVAVERKVFDRSGISFPRVVNYEEYPHPRELSGVRKILAASYVA